MSSTRATGPITGSRFAVVDVETTGLQHEQHHIIQLGVVIADAEGHELDSWVTDVRPPRWPWMRVGPRWVHGISRRRVSRAPSTATVIDEFLRRTEGLAIVAHNLAFDLGFLRAEAESVGRAIPDGPHWCTLTLSRSLDRGFTRSHKLSDLCERYGVSLDRPHDALEDARAASEVIPGLFAEAGITTWEQLVARATPRPPKVRAQR